jgi:hypothetical protein
MKSRREVASIGARWSDNAGSSVKAMGAVDRRQYRIGG